MSFSQKILSADLTLTQGVFTGGSNSLTVTGLRMQAHIVEPGGDGSGNLELAIYGLTLSVMNQLTCLPFASTAIGNNTIVLSAGDDQSQLSIVFQGTINVAYTDATVMPEVCFRVFAIAGHVHRIKPIPPTSINSPSADVGQMMQSLAKQMNYNFENSGVSTTIAYPYYAGAALQQVSAIARHAAIEWTLDGNTLAVWPSGQARNIAPTTISAATGLVSSPAFTASGLILTTLYQGTIKFGAKITVDSVLKPACGDWYVHYIEFDLECQTPKGKWFATLQAGKVAVGQDNS